jgi:hypothetical protein
VIRPVRSHERTRLNATFTKTREFAHDCYVAAKGKWQRIVGCCAVEQTDSAEGREASFFWGTLKGYQGSVLERSLIELAIRKAREGNAIHLRTAEVADAGGPEDRLLEEFGFEVVTIADAFEAKLAHTLHRISDVEKRLRAGGKVPEGAEVVPISDCTWPEAAGLAMRHGLLSHHRAKGGVRESGFSPELSAVLLVDGVVQGALLVRWSGRVVDLPVRVVAERFRGGYGWANLLLLHAPIHWAAGLGCEILRFRGSLEDHRETCNFARRCGAEWRGRQHTRALNLQRDA